MFDAPNDETAIIFALLVANLFQKAIAGVKQGRFEDERGEYMSRWFVGHRTR